MESGAVRLKDIKPTLAFCIRESRMLLSREPLPCDSVVHDVRVNMKKARATLKLIAPQLGNENVASDIFAMREAGRRMCKWRETAVHRKSLKEFKKDYPDLFARLADNEIINSLLLKPDNASLFPANIEAEMKETDELMVKAYYRIRFYRMSQIDPLLLFFELEHTYSLVTDIYLKGRNFNKPEMLHEFRKKAKDLLYQLFFFRPLNPVKIKSMEKRLEIITRNLGRYNDLTQLLEAIDYKYITGKYNPAVNELAVRIRERQDKYLSKIWPEAFKVFCPGRKLSNMIEY